jgi:inner membrane transporter RhtA
LFGTATALMNIFFYLGIDRLPLGKGVAIEFIGPITVAALRTRSRRNAMALALAVLGVAVLSGLEISGGDPLGLLFIFLASAMWAAYIVIGSHVARLDRGVSGLGVGLAIGALVVMPIGAPGSGAAFATPSILALCLLVGVFSNAIGYGIDQHVMRRIPIRRFSVLLALLPVTATVIGFIALGQVPTALDLVGMALVLSGVVIQEREELAPLGADEPPA